MAGKIPKWLLGVGLVAVLLLAGAVTVYSAVPVDGAVIFHEGTTIEDALDAISAYDVTLMQYAGNSGQAGGAGGGGFFEGVTDAQSVSNEFWRRYGRYMDLQTTTIAQVEANFTTIDPDKWSAQKAEIEAEIERFGLNESGCWDRGDCPTFEVERFDVRATVAVLESMESDPVVSQVLWSEKFGLGILGNAQRPPFREWVQSGIVTAGVDNQQTDEESRDLLAIFFWDDPEKLAFLQSKSSALRNGVTLSIQDGTYFTTDTTFFGYPKLVEGWSPSDNFPSPYLEQRDTFEFEGFVDYGFGSLRAELFEPDKVYQMVINMVPGVAEEDDGEVVADVGIRVCRFPVCVNWIDNLIYGDVEMPGPTGLRPNNHFVHVPAVVNDTAAGSEAGQIGTYPAPESAALPK